MSRAAIRLEMNPPPTLASRSAALYLDLIERCLTNTIYGDGYTGVGSPGVERPFDPSLRETGRDWPKQAHTMIGRARLRNLRELVETAIREGVPGDLIETGAWRGGACIMMRATLEAFGDLERRVFVADLFEGLPAPDAETYPADLGDKHHTIEELAVSLDEVKANFAKYGLLDDRVVFLKGWFKDTLRAAPIERLAVLRLDGDMYESTMDALTALYDKVSAGGFVIVDDYGCIEGCRRAVHDFRDARGIADKIVDIDGWGVYWRKSAEAAVPKLAPVQHARASPVLVRRRSALQPKDLSQTVPRFGAASRIRGRMTWRSWSSTTPVPPTFPGSLARPAAAASVISATPRTSASIRAPTRRSG